MKYQQSGFTLIELIMVIVILGVLGATAIPKFTDLSDQAETAAVAGVGGGLGAGSAVNVSVCALDSSLGNCTTVTTCAGVSSTLDGGLPTGYAITGTIDTNSGCTVTHTVSTKTSTFTGHTAP